jgi:hypothetical protein
MAARLGEQLDTLANPFANRVPVLARASIFGVLAAASP